MDMERYRVYAKPIQNNAAIEPTLIGEYEGHSKKAAIHKAMNDHSNKGIYQLDSFFAICVVWQFVPVNK